MSHNGKPAPDKNIRMIADITEDTFRGTAIRGPRQQSQPTQQVSPSTTSTGKKK